jgi:hypothetical protein
MEKKHNFNPGDTVYFRYGNIPMTVTDTDTSLIDVVFIDSNSKQQQYSYRYSALLSEKEYKEFHNLTN